MKVQLICVTLLGSSSALKARWAPCCFHLDASGAVTGTVGQLGDGQNRVNGPLSPAQFCITEGAITDAHGRGCIITPQVTQFQCDASASAKTGFSIGCDGVVAYNGGTTFWECQTGDNGEANIYITPGGSNCGQIALKADGCSSDCNPLPPSGCPTNLEGSYEFPHLIVPIDSSNPSQTAGTSFFGEISATVSTIFNFDIPDSDSGKTCSLIFLFPSQDQLTTSSFTFSGNGGIDFELLASVATNTTTYSNAPTVKTDYGVTQVAPGNSYSVATFSCPAGTTVSFELKANGDTSLKYFQDFNPSPIGLYITKC